MTGRPLVVRLAGGPRAEVPFTLDGKPCKGLEGDMVITAVLAASSQLREHDASGRPHAGFCAMGACQDCWMDTEGGERLRACGTPLEAGMALLTKARNGGLPGPTLAEDTGKGRTRERGHA